MLFLSGCVVTLTGWWLIHLQEGERFPGWFVLWLGGWLLMAGSSAYIALWIPLVIALTTFLFFWLWRRRYPDAPVLGMGYVFALFGIGLLGIGTTTEVADLHFVLAFFVFLMASLPAQRIADEFERSWIAIPILIIVAGFLLGPTGVRSALQMDSMGRLGDTLWQSQLLFLGLSPAEEGERVELANGSVAWLSRPDGEGPFPAALILHGNDNDASQQASALVMHRALVKAGYLVLALDHIGYGDTPLPGLDDGVERWDPQPGRLAAYDWLAEQPDVAKVVLVGHSMGADGVWRLAAEREGAEAISLFGASLAPEQPLRTVDEVEWDDFVGEYERFHEKRGVTGRIDPNLYFAINANYYGTPLSTMGSGPPVTFISFATEWPDIADSRDQLFTQLPEPKENIPFASNHYFSATDWRGVMAGDTRVMDELVSLFSERK